MFSCISLAAFLSLWILDEIVECTSIACSYIHRMWALNISIFSILGCRFYYSWLFLHQIPLFMWINWSSVDCFPQMLAKYFPFVSIVGCRFSSSCLLLAPDSFVIVRCHSEILLFKWDAILMLYCVLEISFLPLTRLNVEDIWRASHAWTTLLWDRWRDE